MSLKFSDNVILFRILCYLIYYYLANKESVSASTSFGVCPSFILLNASTAARCCANFLFLPVPVGYFVPRILKANPNIGKWSMAWTLGDRSITWGSGYPYARQYSCNKHTGCLPRALEEPVQEFPGSPKRERHLIHEIRSKIVRMKWSEQNPI